MLTKSLRLLHLSGGRRAVGCDAGGASDGRGAGEPGCECGPPLVRANASGESFVPLEVALDPEEYKRRRAAEDRRDPDGPQDPGNRAITFRGEKRSNATHRSVTDPDCRFGSTGTSGMSAFSG